MADPQTPPQTQQTSGTPNIPAATPAAPERPEWLPEKFKSAEDFAKSYAELEAKLGQQPPAPGSAEAAQAAADAVAPKPETQPQRTTVDTVLQKAGLSQAELTQEYAENQGVLTDDTYTKLEEAGYSREIVDQYLDGQKARAAQERADVFKEIKSGGSDWDKVAQWLGDNTAQADIDSFNALMNGTDTNAKRIAIRDAYARYADANGSEGNLLQGQGTPGGADTYSHYDEFRLDMRNPEYSKNAAFRNKVMAKYARSKSIQV